MIFSTLELPQHLQGDNIFIIIMPQIGQSSIRRGLVNPIFCGKLKFKGDLVRRGYDGMISFCTLYLNLRATCYRIPLQNCALQLFKNLTFQTYKSCLSNVNISVPGYYVQHIFSFHIKYSKNIISCKCSFTLIISITVKTSPLRSLIRNQPQNYF